MAAGDAAVDISPRVVASSCLLTGLTRRRGHSGPGQRGDRCDTFFPQMLYSLEFPNRNSLENSRCSLKAFLQLNRPHVDEARAAVTEPKPLWSLHLLHNIFSRAD